MRYYRPINIPSRLRNVCITVIYETVKVELISLLTEEQAGYQEKRVCMLLRMMD